MLWILNSLLIKNSGRIQIMLLIIIQISLTSFCRYVIVILILISSLNFNICLNQLFFVLSIYMFVLFFVLENLNTSSFAVVFVISYFFWFWLFNAVSPTKLAIVLFQIILIKCVKFWFFLFLVILMWLFEFL